MPACFLPAFSSSALATVRSAEGVPISRPPPQTPRSKPGKTRQRPERPALTPHAPGTSNLSSPLRRRKASSGGWASRYFPISWPASTRGQAVMRGLAPREKGQKKHDKRSRMMPGTKAGSCGLLTSNLSGMLLQVKKKELEKIEQHGWFVAGCTNRVVRGWLHLHKPSAARVACMDKLILKPKPQVGIKITNGCVVMHSA